MKVRIILNTLAGGLDRQTIDVLNLHTQADGAATEISGEILQALGYRALAPVYTITMQEVDYKS